MKKILMLLILSTSVIAETLSFNSFQTVLNKNLIAKKTENGFETYFNYKRAKSDSETMKLMMKQAESLKSFDPDSISTRKEALSFWINTYNFFMIRKILKNGFKGSKLSINSVKDLGSLLNPYSAFGDKFANIGGKKMSLDDIEKGWLLSTKGNYKSKYKNKKWKDARIHFAVNCASVGCPSLQKSLYTSDNVDSFLNDVTKQAFATKRHFHFQGDTLRISALFKWYENDFTEYAGSVQKFIATFIEDEILKEKILKSKKIDYIKYNWKLNIVKNFKKSNKKKDWKKSE